MRHRLSMAGLVMGIAGLAIIVGPAAPAAAHPLGNFTVNLYSGIEVMPHRLEVEYVLDMAEIPTFREKRAIDEDGNGEVSEAEGAAWSDRMARDLAGRLTLSVNGHPTRVDLISDSMRLLPGQGGLEVLRLEATYAAPAPESGRLEYRDGNYAGRLGWREIIAIGLDGRRVRHSTVPSNSVSDALRSYPEDLLSSPLEVTAASLSFGPGPQRSVGSESSATGVRPGGGAAFVGLVARPSLSSAVVLMSLLLAFALGALHALAPGHGKTLMAAYLVGAGGKVRQAVGVGAAVSAMHTASVLGIGLLVLSVERTFSPEQVYPWLGLTAGVVALVLGVGLLATRLRAANSRRRVLGHAHSHVHPGPPLLSRKGLGAIAVAGGILPSPAALLVLLAAVALHRMAFGLSLIGAFSLGLAAALVVVGVLAIRAKDLITGRLHGRLAMSLPIISAAAIAVVGVILTIRAALQL